MNIDIVCEIILICLYSIFSIIRIVYYRKVKKSGYKTVIEERARYAVWLSVLICYEVFTFFAYVLFPDALSWASLVLPSWVRLSGAVIGIAALLWFIWIHQTLGYNHSSRIGIKDSHYLVTHGPYRRIRHPMYSAFFLLHLSAFLLTSNWFIGLTWMTGLVIIILLRVKREEAMLVTRFGQEYTSYMAYTGRFFPALKQPKNSNK